MILLILHSCTEHTVVILIHATCSQVAPNGTFPLKRLVLSREFVSSALMKERSSFVTVKNKCTPLHNPTSTTTWSSNCTKCHQQCSSTIASSVNVTFWETSHYCEMQLVSSQHATVKCTPLSLSLSIRVHCITFTSIIVLSLSQQCSAWQLQVMQCKWSISMGRSIEAFFTPFDTLTSDETWWTDTAIVFIALQTHMDMCGNLLPCFLRDKRINAQSQSHDEARSRVHRSKRWFICSFNVDHDTLFTVSWRLSTVVSTIVFNTSMDFKLILYTIFLCISVNSIHGKSWPPACLKKPITLSVCIYLHSFHHHQYRVLVVTFALGQQLYVKISIVTIIRTSVQMLTLVRR